MRSFLAGVAFLTRLPVGKIATFDATDVAQSAGWFSFIGLLLGGIYALAAALLRTHLPPAVTAVLLIVIDALLTGALHFDGLADTADGFGGGKTRDDVLRIMRDHSIGSYGGLALAALVALKLTAYTALLQQSDWLPALILIPALGRWSMLLLTATLPYARPSASVIEGMGKTIPVVGHGARNNRSGGGPIRARLDCVDRDGSGHCHVWPLLQEAHLGYHRRHPGRQPGALRERGAPYLRLDTVAPMTRFWLVRHGALVEEARNRCYGSLDFALSETGREQMARAAAYLAREPISAIYTSSLCRAIESARIVAARASTPIHGVPDLREMNFGDLEGLTYDEIATRHPDIYRRWMNTPTEVLFPGGESFREMRARVLGAFAAIQAESEGQTVAIVTHGGVIRILIAWALGMPDNCLFRLAQDHGAVSLLTITDGFPSVQLLNYQVPCDMLV